MTEISCFLLRCFLRKFSATSSLILKLTHAERNYCFQTLYKKKEFLPSKRLQSTSLLLTYVIQSLVHYIWAYNSLRCFFLDLKLIFNSKILFLVALSLFFFLSYVVTDFKHTFITAYHM